MKMFINSMKDGNNDCKNNGYNKENNDANFNGENVDDNQGYYLRYYKQINKSRMIFSN